jgi:hypothetical protein
VLAYAHIAAAKDWWIQSFDCREVGVPQDWDATAPSDVALKLPGHDRPTILLRDRSECERPLDRAILFCSKIQKAREYLLGRGVAAGPILQVGGTDFFEVRDLEDQVIEICREL